MGGTAEGWKVEAGDRVYLTSLYLDGADTQMGLRPLGEQRSPQKFLPQDAKNKNQADMIMA